MEEKQPEPQVEEKKEASGETVKVKKSKATLILIIIIAILVIIILAGVGYYLGSRSGTQAPQQSVSPTPTSASIQPTSTQSSQMNPTVSPSALSKTIYGGNSGGSFKAYKLDIPASWSDTTETVPNISTKTTLTKGNYSISIYQAAFGGGGCLYPGDPPSEMAQSFTDFVEMPTANGGTFRRSWNKTGNPAGTIAYNVCQKSTTENSYGSPTSFGAISAKSPDPADAATMKEVDSILSSIAIK